jgi:dolichyl-phosphate-mannose--protein O-mannosyl transferase
MLVGLAGLLSGYDGNFEFKSGTEYGDAVSYVAMRVMMATFGVTLVPLGWYTAVELGMGAWATHLVALMVLCGKYFVTLVYDDSDFICRCGLAVHLAIHFARFHAIVRHIRHSLFPLLVP